MHEEDDTNDEIITLKEEIRMLKAELLETRRKLERRDIAMQHISLAVQAALK